MTKLQRKNVNKELSALARLSDGDIDTSDIPEIRDWSRAISGRFYKAGGQDMSRVTAVLSRNDRNSVSVLVGEFPTQGTGRGRIVAMANEELIETCVGGIPEAWSEFVHRFQPLITTVIFQRTRHFGIQSRDRIEDLVQETYMRLAADNCRLLRSYHGNNENSFLGLLKIIAANVVQDHFRSLYSTKRGNRTTDAYLEVREELAGQIGNAARQEHRLLLEEIDRILKTKASENERAVFWLHYTQGFTASEIAALPKIDLKVKGVESLLHRLLRRIKSELARQNP